MDDITSEMLSLANSITDSKLREQLIKNIFKMKESSDKMSNLFKKLKENLKDSC